MKSPDLFFVGTPNLRKSGMDFGGGGDPRISFEIFGYRYLKPISSEVGGGKITGGLQEEMAKKA